MQPEPQTDLAERVAKLAAQLVAVNTIDTSTPLADVGFDSLAYAELALVVEEEFGIRLADADVEGLRTCRSLAEEVARLRAATPAPAIPDGIGRHQRLAERTLEPILARWFRFEVVGAAHVPREGPVVVSANHNSLLDIPFLTLAMPRPIWFMAKVELFAGRVASWFFHALGGFPVRRQVTDLRAVGTALAVLRSGRLLGMFPEGTRSREELLPFLPGAAWMALATGAPLVPVGIRGAAESLPRGRVIPKRTRVRVAIGEPVPVEREDDPAWRRARAMELTAHLRRAVSDLLA
jgi:1-acyl-sn-glycerol-3-phosphate acyltransferase